MAKTNQEDLNKFYQKIHEKTKNKKILSILTGEIPWAFYQYPVDMLGEELKSRYIETIIYKFNSLYEMYAINQDNDMLKLIEELIGQEAYKKCMDDLYFYDDLDEVGYSKKVKTKDLQELYEEGKLDKEAVMQIVKHQIHVLNAINT